MQPIKSSKIRIFNKITLDYPLLGKIITNSKKNESRKFHAYCLGLPRTGTHSIANMFATNFEAAHEPYATGLIRLLLDKRLNEKLSIEQFLFTRDRLLSLEMEANHLMHRFAPDLVDIFPKSKYILTVREPYSWLESEYNKILKSNRTPRKGYNWRTYDRLKYGEKSLKGLNTKDEKDCEEIFNSMLRYYQDHIKYVLDSVPNERLMVIDTFKINDSIDGMANFLECNDIRTKLFKKHSAKNSKKIRINSLVSEERLQGMIKENCNDFIKKNIPVLEGYIK